MTNPDSYGIPVLTRNSLAAAKKAFRAVRGHWTYLQVPLAIWAWWSGNWGCHMNHMIY
jgi:hypothetical protein